MDYEIRRSFSIRGEWWDHVNPERRFPGELSFRKRKMVHLDVAGIFDGWYRGERGHNSGPVYGETYRGECVTVVDAFATSIAPMHNPKGSVTKIEATALLIGPHHVSENDEIFRSCTFELAEVTKWLNRDAFERGEDSVVRRDLPTIEIALKSIGGKLSVWAASYESFRPYDPRLMHKEVWTIDVEEPKTFSFFRKTVLDIVTLCSLLIGKVARLDRLSLQTLPSDSKDPPQITEYIFRHPKKKYGGTKSHYRPHFEWDEIMKGAPDFIDRWLALPTEQMSIARSVHNSRTGSAKYVEINLLAIAAGLESLGANLEIAKLVPEEEWLQLREKINLLLDAETLPKVREVLRQKISHMNNRSLRDVLNVILDDMPPEVSTRIQYGDVHYAAKFVKTRNALVHPPSSSSRPHRHDVSGNVSEMVLLIEITEHLILHKVLVWLGVPEEYLLSRYEGGSNLSELFNHRLGE